MTLHVTFKQQNPDFDKEIARDYHFGKESEGNWKDLWSEEYKLPFDIDKIAIIEKGELKLNGKKVNGEELCISIPNMTILDCYIGNEVKAQFAVSKELIKNTHKTYNEKYNTTRYYFYLKPINDFIKLSDLIFVINKDIPETLFKKNTLNKE